MIIKRKLVDQLAIEIILKQYESDNLALKPFKEDFGILKGKTGEIFDELRILKSEGKENLEQLTK